MYLVDTNIFLEGLLEQEKAQTVGSFFQTIDSEKIFITDLSLHSIGIILFRLGEHKLFDLFLDDVLIDGISVLSLKPDALKKVDKVAQTFHLDFDDAYQYVVADEYNFQLISFDSDFDKTVQGRKEPKEIVQ